MTNVFNVFVFMTLFNMISARKINDELNIFEGIFRNKMYGIILSVIIIGQVLIVMFGGKAFKVSTSKPAISGE